MPNNIRPVTVEPVVQNLSISLTGSTPTYDEFVFFVFQNQDL